MFTGIYYDSGKEPPPDGPPKLHLLIESNEEYKVNTRPFLRAYRSHNLAI
jgi:hypothetical protein